ncbi:uncharacterized protein EI90DRAFT_3045906 [Cantharellus anzutake]|uniref:uncharacterized protein n=1 Tax=Cantharellus anzutake TaxID=1750568 RepID=UPI0019030E10|nr:uncharacterized protein EI90DRAFT_3045906 [Cantharellus anzutake]KAF8336482.1 hypothetical protein EI90DRAFT_3045906 [Cantharellus anzutake]
MQFENSEEYKRTTNHVAKQTFRDRTSGIPFFEITIPYLGGFLSAYGLSGDFGTLGKSQRTRRGPAFHVRIGFRPPLP